MNTNKGDAFGFFTPEFRNKVASGYFQTPYPQGHHAWDLVRQGVVKDVRDVSSNHIDHITKVNFSNPQSNYYFWK